MACISSEVVISVSLKGCNVKEWNDNWVICINRKLRRKLKFARFNFMGKTGGITIEILRNLVGITKLDRERNQSVREKLGVQGIVRETKQYQLKWLYHLREWTQIGYAI